MINGYKGVKRIISDAMLKLDKDDYQIIYELFFKHTSIHQLSKKLGISRSGVRYRKTKALKQLKSIISKEIDGENRSRLRLTRSG
jgi:RNA polymerase sigma factor (sigma-70 family)